jgi:hypothetical protein
MKGSQKYFGLLASVLLILLAFAYPAIGQANRYAHDGLSFNYPAGWALSDESDAQVQSLSLDRGKDEAKIMVVSLRQQMTAAEISQAQSSVTEAIVNNLAHAMQQLGAQVQRTSISASIGETRAVGIRLRANLHGEAGNADVYQLVLGGRLVNVVLIGSDPELLRAATAWNMVCSSLRVGTPAVAPPTQPAGQEINWATRADSMRGRNGQQFTFVCPANGSLSNTVWGNDIYSDDSSICAAAVHAGLISIQDGGEVTIQIRAGADSYASTERNGVRTRGYGVWPGSFVFVR